MSGTRGTEKTKVLVWFYCLLILIIGLDQASKALALQYLQDKPSVAVIPGIFHLTLVYNTGIAFGMFRNQAGLLFILITVSVIFLFAWGRRSHKMTLLPRTAIALILSGAIGNWIDRWRVGAVIDFFDFRVWPVFNIADTAITAGVCLYILYFIRTRNTETSNS